MKTKLIALSAFFLLSPVSFASTFILDPTATSLQTQNVVLSSPDWTDFTVFAFPSFDTTASYSYYWVNTTLELLDSFCDETFCPGMVMPSPTTFYFVGVTDSLSSIVCGAGTLQECRDSVGFQSEQSITYTLATGSSDNAFMIQLGNATTTFQETTGFDVAGVVTWSVDNLIKLFIGSGLAVLLYLRGWIVAMVIIGSIVYFAYRAFRFFRH